MKNLKNYELNVNVEKTNTELEKIKNKVSSNLNKDTFKKVFNLIDLTTLTETDNEALIEKMCTKVNDFKSKHSEMDNVAAICVYPAMVGYVKKHLKKPDINIASVAGGFPASQTFTEIKTAECKMAVDAGANEIDIVIPVGEFIAGNEQLVFDEVMAIKKQIGDAHLKVILETGDLTPNQIRKTSLIAMEAGADFIKTSTGKVAVSATHEAMYIMCEAIKDYHNTTGRMVGIKPAGGIREANDSAIYYEIVKTVLGERWLNNQWFRFGASSLANSLLHEIYNTKENYF